MLCALGISFLALNTCSSGQTCPGACPAANASATVLVTAVPATTIADVQAALTGPVSGAMTCQPTSSTSAMLCQWPYGATFTPGAYSLQVSAPGYQSTTVQVEVAVSAPICGNCRIGSIQPSSVSLVAVDGGVD